MVRHLRRPDVEAEARPVGVTIAAPMQPPAAVGPLPPVQLGVRRPLARELRGRGGGGREQRQGALRVHAAREVADAAGGEQGRERERLSGYVRDERRRITQPVLAREQTGGPGGTRPRLDRKSTRLNSSHSPNSYAVFCFEKKKTQMRTHLA